MITSLANGSYRAFILLFLWNIFKSVDPSLAEIPLWVHFTMLGILGVVSGLSDTGNPK